MFKFLQACKFYMPKCSTNCELYIFYGWIGNDDYNTFPGYASMELPMVLH